MRQTTSPVSSVLKHGEISSSKDLNECVYKNDIDGARACLLGNKMAWNTRNRSGLTPLMEASTLSRIEILDLLLSSKCDVNVTDENGNTSLHLAVDEGNTEVVRKLIGSGRCIVDAKNVKGETALMKAAFYDYNEMARIMLTDGDADPDVRDKTGQTALHIALREGSHVTVDLLLRHGCDVTAMDSLGQSALYVAIHSPCNKTLDLAKKLIATGYDISVDKIWLVNNEKHNLFYQDDDFYTTLRQSARQSASGKQNELHVNTCRKISSGSNQSDTANPLSPKQSRSPILSPKQLSPTTSPLPLSPSLKQKIMSSETPKYPSVQTNKINSSGTNFTWSSTKRKEFLKSKSFEQVQPRTPLRPPLTSSFSSDSDDSPLGSPALRHRTFSLNTKISIKGNNCNMTSLMMPSPIVRPEVTKDGRAVTSAVQNNKPLYLRSDKEMPRSAPNSPNTRCRRQLSERNPPRSGSHENVNERKISLPAKTSVTFNTEIKVFEYNRRQ